jgi:DNA-binding transcriptional MerR regulator
MDKSPEAFRTISEVADALDVPPHVLRFWETRFAQVKPVKRGGGRRYYRPEDVRLLRGIRGLLYDDGMTIKGVQKILRERGVRHVISLGTVAGPEFEPNAESVADLAAAPVPTPGHAAVRNGAVRPQADLFEPSGDTAVDTAPAPEASRPAPQPDTRGKSALRDLVAELEALRAVMIQDPPR